MPQHRRSSAVDSGPLFLFLLRLNPQENRVVGYLVYEVTFSIFDRFSFETLKSVDPTIFYACVSTFELVCWALSRSILAPNLVSTATSTAPLHGKCFCRQLN